MKPEDLGYNSKLEKFRTEQIPDSFEIGRVVAEHKERYIVKTTNVELEAEITGNLRYTAVSREDFPAVGDWVALTVYDSDSALIHTIFPRFSVIQRKSPGQFGGIQIIATNVDHAFLVQAVDRDFNINRIERYLTICNASKVNPVIVLSKTDLINEQRVSEIMESIKLRIPDVPVIPVSNETRGGYDAISNKIKKGKTYCMLGSSGVGKSTLLNNLAGRILMKTDAISQNTNKGRHITSHRELIVLDNGGILIDNPGMREVGLADTTDGLEITFDTIIEFAQACRFSDCTHHNETGCAVIEAVKNGDIDRSSYDNYMKMEKEKKHFESTVAEKRKKDKIFGKMIKDYYRKDTEQ